VEGLKYHRHLRAFGWDIEKLPLAGFGRGPGWMIYRLISLGQISSSVIDPIYQKARIFPEVVGAKPNAEYS